MSPESFRALDNLDGWGSKEGLAAACAKRGWHRSTPLPDGLICAPSLSKLGEPAQKVVSRDGGGACLYGISEKLDST